MKRLISCLSFILISTLLIAQTEEMPAEEHIQAMREGTVLIRLKKHTNKIEKLKEMGETKKAKALEEEDIQKNEKVMEAFKESFTFCNFYFFYSDKTMDIKNLDLEGRLISPDGADVPYETIKAGPIYAAEFGFILNDVGNERASGLRAMTRQMEQLKAPFPYGQIADFILWERSEKLIVKLWNNKLFKFLSAANARTSRAKYKAELKTLKEQ